MKHPRFEEFDHTADLGIRIWGNTLSELFVNGAIGMFTLIGDEALMATSEPKLNTEEIKIEAETLDMLLHTWLSELLFLHHSKRLYFTGFTVESISGRGLKAQACGAPLANYDLSTFLDFKAVTYHQLSLNARDDGYTATVIFDI